MIKDKFEHRPLDRSMDYPGDIMTHNHADGLLGLYLAHLFSPIFLSLS